AAVARLEMPKPTVRAERTHQVTSGRVDIHVGLDRRKQRRMAFAPGFDLAGQPRVRLLVERQRKDASVENFPPASERLAGGVDEEVFVPGHQRATRLTAGAGVGAGARRNAAFIETRVTLTSTTARPAHTFQPTRSCSRAAPISTPMGARR